MRFFVNKDVSGGIHFWLAPDNPRAISRVFVSVDGRRTAELSAWITDDTIRANGWHSTGQCVYMITEKELPELASANRIEIFDADTNILIYRSIREKVFLPAKLISITTTVQKNTFVEQNLFDLFQYSYFNVDRLSEEVVQSIMQGPWLTSSLITGAVIFPRYEVFFQDDHCVSGVLIQDPFEEMAARMRWLQSKKAITDDPAQNWRLGGMLESVRFAAEYDLSNSRNIKRFLRMLPEPCYRFLYNPLCRQFGTRSPSDPFAPGNSIVAMEIISRIKVVGHSDYTSEYYTALLDRLGVAPIAMSHPKPSEDVLSLAALLRSVDAARDMVAFDTVISDAVRHAVGKSWQ